MHCHDLLRTRAPPTTLDPVEGDATAEAWGHAQCLQIWAVTTRIYWMGQAAGISIRSHTGSSLAPCNWKRLFGEDTSA